MQDLLDRFLKGETRALARLISMLENEDPDRDEIIRSLYGRTGRAYILGVTGSPGAGKSSLVDSLTNELRKRGNTVGIIAVDPTSPFTGGAILGDRIRMQNHAVDQGVFIRSMGTRGSLGGLARTSKEVVKAMDAFGLDWVIIETVGVGQAELDIMHVADSTVVVLTPGAGDGIQSIKAGIMEIADVFAVNKCDLPGADKVVAETQVMLDMQHDRLQWRPPVVKTSSSHNIGIVDLVDAIDSHRAYLQSEGIFEKRRQERAQSETLEIADYQWQQMVKKEINLPGRVKELLEDVAAKRTDPYAAAASILEHVVANSRFSR